MNRFLKLFISVSILMNLLLTGILIGHVGVWVMGMHPHYSVPEIAAALPEESRKVFEESMQRFEQDTGELREQLNDSRKKAASLLKAEPFDKKAYLAQMQDVQERRADIMKRMVETIAQVAEHATPQARAVLADMMRHSPRQPGDS